MKNTHVLPWRIFRADSNSPQRRLPSHGIPVMLKAQKNSQKGANPMNNYVTGAAIRTLREKQHLTQAQLAERISVSDKTVSKWETGVSHS